VAAGEDIVEAKRPIVDLIFLGGNWFNKNFALCIHEAEERIGTDDELMTW
jgi:hypothetical protein